MNENMLQAMINGMSAQWQRERADTQMTLGKLIAKLETLPSETLIDGVAEPHSYRGYYSDLAFERSADKIKAADLLALCRSAMGKVFEGYKGGEFVMGEKTSLWIAFYGFCGDKILDLDESGVFVVG